MKEIVEKLRTLNLFSLMKIKPGVREIVVTEMEYTTDENGIHHRKGLVRRDEKIKVDKKIILVDEIVKEFIDLVISLKKKDSLINVFELKDSEENTQELIHFILESSDKINEDTRIIRSCTNCLILSERHEEKVKNLDNLRIYINNSVEDYIIIIGDSHITQPGITFFYDEENELYSFELLGKHPEFNYQILNLKN